MNSVTGDSVNTVPNSNGGGGGGSVDLSNYTDIEDPTQTVVDTIPVFKTSGRKRLKLTSIKATELDTRITTNTNSITATTVAVGAAASAIVSNDTDIATLTSDAVTDRGTITTNATNIAANTVNITNNTTTLGTTTNSLIAAALAIQGNDTDIATLTSAAANDRGTITANTTNITTNATNVSNVTASVVATAVVVDALQSVSVYTGADVGSTPKAAGDVYGPTSTYTSASALASGVPVTTDNVAGALRVKLMTTTWETCIGFTVGTTTAAGQSITVATTGAICVVQKQTVAATPVVHELTAASSVAVQTDQYVRFTDSGGLAPAGSPLASANYYQNNENYSVVFDAGSGGEWGVLANDWDMESTTLLYDRLGLQVADLPSGPWVNASIPNWWTTTTTTAPWNSTRATYGPGWMLTGTPSKFETSSTPGYTHATRSRVTIAGKRYIKFTFFSDGGATRPGWDIDLLSSQFSQVGKPLFLDLSTSGNVVDGGTGPVLASLVGTDDTNNLVYARVA